MNKYGIKIYREQGVERNIIDNISLDTTLPGLEVYETFEYTRYFPGANDGEYITDTYEYKNPFNYVPIISMFTTNDSHTKSSSIPGYGVDGLWVFYNWNYDGKKLYINASNVFGIGMPPRYYNVKFYVYKNNFFSLFDDLEKDQEISFIKE